MSARHDRRLWIRWLSARGVPPGHIARVLDCDAAVVAKSLRAEHGNVRHDIDPETAAAIDRLRAEGKPWRAIGPEVGLPWMVAYGFHRRSLTWYPSNPSRPPGGGSGIGPMARKIRRLAALDYEAAHIAELLGLEPDRVASILAGPKPRPLIRREWGIAQGPEWRDEPAPPPPAKAAAAEPPSYAVPELPPPIAEDWGAPTGGRVGQRSPVAALSDEDADRIRELRARGVARRDVATMFGVSVATVTRISRGETYRPVVVPEPDQVVIPEPPAIAAAEVPEPTVWTEPRRRRGRPLPPEYRDD